MQPISDDPIRWRRAFWLLLAVTAITKLLLASRLSLFVDEAFYWQESRHPAWSYSDLPALTAWLIRSGETLFGHGTLAVRLPFIAMALLIPLLVRSIATRHFGERCGWQAACWTLLLPLLASLGVLALPDVPLTLFCLLAIDALDRLAERPQSLPLAAWLGLLLALAWLSHYRAAMLWLAGLVFLLATPRGRALWSRRDLWLAVLVGCIGLLPAWLGDAAIGGDAFRFQLVDRHPWAFHADALVQPLEQALVTTPLLYALLLATLLAGWRLPANGRRAPWDVLISVAASFVIGYFVLGLFADAQRFRIHWPLPAYLALMIGLPTMLAAWMRHRAWLRHVAVVAAALAGIATLMVYAYFAAASIPGGASWLSRYKAFPEHFVGWTEAAETTASLLQRPGFEQLVLVADNFMLAAELDFALEGSRPVFSLDHPLNIKHGRAPQLRLWQRDEAGLALLAGSDVLLLVDETAGRERERAEWLGSLCARIVDLRWVAGIDLYEGRRRISWYRGRVPAAGTADVGDCSYPPVEPSPELSTTIPPVDLQALEFAGGARLVATHND